MTISWPLGVTASTTASLLLLDAMTWPSLCLAKLDRPVRVESGLLVPLESGRALQKRTKGHRGTEHRVDEVHTAASLHE